MLGHLNPHQGAWASKDFISWGNDAPGVQVEGFSFDFDFNFSYSQKLSSFTQKLWKKSGKCRFQIKRFAMLH